LNAAIDALRQDVSYCTRLLRKNAAFVISAAMTLALGIVSACSAYRVEAAELFTGNGWH